MNRKVLGVNGHLAAVDFAEACDYAVVWNVFLFHAKTGAVVPDSRINFLECVFVAKGVDALNRVKLSFCVLFFNIVFHK